ncbi:extracellular solute-binding protein [Paenibacillus donghaensis]|uniref:extracellular solute-binding protein n=1 Tax=Paenibacillus donghaensis TaxID=414771 RepID=UPI001883F1B4|nr:extracellular solute-binding protein [Paenibacillus donghaensis]MBE9915402.1 extracellular solute-binding protein [Paenibacillus donghaensis]
MKRTGFIVLMVMMLILSACGDKKEAAGGTGGGEASSGEAGKQKDGGKMPLKWFVVASADAQLPAKDKDFVKKTIDEKFGVDLTVDYMPYGPDFQNKLNSLISSGDTPDVFYTDGVASNQYIKDGVAREIKELVTPQTMPNYFKHWVSEKDLGMYQVQGKFARAPIPYPKDIYRSYYIRKDWLDNLGLAMPANYDEMIEVMKAFTEKDPDGNGKKDTYGFTTYGGGTNMSLDFPEFVKHGLIGDFMVEGDKFIDTRTDLRVEQVLNDIKKVMDMGIVDPDWLLAKNGQQLEKAEQGKVGIVLGVGKNLAFDNNPEGLQVKTKQITGNDKVDWQPFHPFANTGTWLETVPGNPFLLSSQSSDDKIKKSLEILDWLAGEEGYLLTHYGQEGTDYTREGNKIKINQEAFKQNVTDNGNFLTVYQWFTPVPSPEVLGLELDDPSITERDKKIVETIDSYKIVPSVGTSVVVKEGMDLAGLRKRMNEIMVSIVFDEKDASKWPEYRKELMTKYGGNEIFNYYAEQVSNASGKTVTFAGE